MRQRKRKRDKIIKERQKDGQRARNKIQTETDKEKRERCIKKEKVR